MGAELLIIPAGIVAGVLLASRRRRRSDAIPTVFMATASGRRAGFAPKRRRR